MKFTITALGALALTSTLATTSAMAGGLDRTGLNYGLLFEEGKRAEIGFSRVSPSVSGTFAPAFGGSSTGNMANSYTSYSLAYKADLTEKLSFGIYLTTPYGASAQYKVFPYAGLNADWESKQLAGLLRYKITPSVSVYGGLRSVTSSAKIAIPDALIRGGLAASGSPTGASLAANASAGSLAYTANGEKDTQSGYVVGAAFEKPEIALRVGLTYESGMTHSFRTTELIPAVPSVSGVGTTIVEIPQSVKLDFQSGVAKDTLVFGSIKWAEWSVWEVRPPGYNALTGSDVTSFDNNVISYQIGIGRKLNENLSVFARAGYEKANGGVASRLAPTDGSRSIGIGGSYTKDNMKITGGIEYVKLGDAVDGSGTRFAGNSATGVGISVSFGF